MTRKIKSLEEELAKLKANVIGVEEMAKEMPSEGKGQVFKCDICNYKTKKDVTLKKHKNTKHGMFMCKECGQYCNSQRALEEHYNKEHIQSSTTYTQFDEDNNCPICSKGFMSKQNMLDHIKEHHMNQIDTQQNQTLSALITTEAKANIVRSEHDEMTLDDYDKMLDKYEALYATDDEESSDSEC